MVQGEAYAAAARAFDAVAAQANVTDEQKQQLCAGLQSLTEDRGSTEKIVLPGAPPAPSLGVRVQELRLWGTSPDPQRIRGAHSPSAQAGLRLLTFEAPGTARCYEEMEIRPGSPVTLNIDWREHVEPSFGVLRRQWPKLMASGLPAVSYLNRLQRRRQTRNYVAVGVIFTLSGTVVTSLCAANVGGFCATTWQQGLAYSFGPIFAASGVLIATAVQRGATKDADDMLKDISSIEEESP